jgi:hypothetical protein
MIKTAGISCVILLAAWTNAQSQSQAGTQAPAAQIAQEQPATVAVNPAPARRQDIQPKDLGVYSDCYMKCINSGHQDDFCKTDAKQFCY